MVKIKQRRKKNKLVILTATVTGALLIVGAGSYAYFTRQNAQDTSTGESGETINYDPPTDEEKAQTEKHKKDLAEQSEGEDQQQAPDDGSKKQADPIISSWGQNPDNKSVSVSAFISAVYENGGTCTLTLEKSGQKVTESQTARKGAQTTDCGQIIVPRSSLSAGTWKATMAYSSATAEGKSQAVNIEVE